jgi:hypothetical protein
MNPENLEAMIVEFDKNEALYISTENLKPALEGQITEVLANGENLDEKTALSLQAKRGMLELIPGKLDQIATLRKTLQSNIETEFNKRYAGLSKKSRELSGNAKTKLKKNLESVVVGDVLAEETCNFVFPRTKIVSALANLENSIQFHRSSGNIVGAARALLSAEKAISEIATGELNQ